MDLPSEPKTREESYPFFISYRFVLVVMSFFGMLNLYALRANISVAMVCMVNSSLTQPPPQNLSPVPEECLTNVQTSGNITTDINDLGGEFNWDRPTQGMILSSFFWGYLLTQVPGGWLSNAVGGKRVIGYSMGVCAVLALLAPLCAHHSHMLLVANRVGQGLTQGTFFPANFMLWSRWAPPLERSRILSFSSVGMAVGSITINPVAAVLCDTIGWPSVFYVFGALCLVWVVAWFILVSDTPSTHRWISPAERHYITTSLEADIGRHDDATSRSVPWRGMLMCRVFWVTIVGHMGGTWALYTLLTNLPTFINEILRVNIKENGVYSSLPYVFSVLVMWGSGWLSDWLVETNRMKKVNVRRIMQLIGLIGSGAFLVGVGYADCTQVPLAVSLLVISVGIMGTRMSGHGTSHVEVPGRYADVMMGISNTFATIPGIVAPYLIGYLTRNHTPGEWQLVFWIACGIMTVAAVLYCVFVKAETQPWALQGEDITGRPNTQLTAVREQQTNL